MAAMCAGWRGVPENFAKIVPWICLILFYLSESGHESKASAMQSDPCAPDVGTRQAETSFYSQRFQDFSRISQWILDTVRFKDEAWFQVSGYVNS